MHIMTNYRKISTKLPEIYRIELYASRCSFFFLFFFCKCVELSQIFQTLRARISQRKLPVITLNYVTYCKLRNIILINRVENFSKYFVVEFLYKFRRLKNYHKFIQKLLVNYPKIRNNVKLTARMISIEISLLFAISSTKKNLKIHRR